MADTNNDTDKWIFLSANTDIATDTNILVNNDTDNISVVHWSKQSEHGPIDIKYSLGVPRSLTGFYSHSTVDKKHIWQIGSAVVLPKVSHNRKA